MVDSDGNAVALQAIEDLRGAARGGCSSDCSGGARPPQVPFGRPLPSLVAGSVVERSETFSGQVAVRGRGSQFCVGRGETANWLRLSQREEAYLWFRTFRRHPRNRVDGGHTWM